MDWLRWMIDEVARWQTLLAGAVALAAAWWAARPVWRQLDRMEVQSNVMLREIVVSRITELERRRLEAMAPTGAVVSNIEREIGWDEGDDAAHVTEEWAFAQWQMLQRAADKFENFRRSHRDADPSEVLKDRVDEAILGLLGVLDDIHTPASRDQHGDDHDIPDVEWAAIEARGVAARAELAAATASLGGAAAALGAAYVAEQQRMRTRLVAMDGALLG